MKNQKGFSKIAVIIIAAIVIAVAGWRYLWRPYTNIYPVTPTPTVSSTTDPTAGSPRDEILRGWQTYRNEQYGFEFQTPANWIIENESRDVGNGVAFITDFKSPDFKQAGDMMNEVDVLSGYLLNIHLQYPSNIKTFSELTEFLKLGRGGHIQLSEKLILVDGEKTILHDLGDYRQGSLKDVHFLHGDKWFTITFSYANYEDDQFNQILSTFKFIK
ncbi:MAG: hypothetical protein HYX21_02255 [Candidatus Yanofskybacteria bacterium]|nr:hypothetical protein [Candidatus Yanofskybacteria bacterium]